jgi:hypothetical protein
MHLQSFSDQRSAHPLPLESIGLMSGVARAVTYVGLEIVGKLADVLGVNPAEFFRRPVRPGFRRKAE